MSAPVVPPKLRPGDEVRVIAPSRSLATDLLRRIVGTKPELRDVPVACDFDFGHTSPLFTFPVGGRARLDCPGGGRG